MSCFEMIGVKLDDGHTFILEMDLAYGKTRGQQEL